MLADLIESLKKPWKMDVELTFMVSNLDDMVFSGRATGV